MKKLTIRKKAISIILEYVIAIVSSLILLTLVMRLWKADFSIPFYYSGDALYTGMNIKSIVDNGWYLVNDFVGSPNGLNMAEYPMAEGINFIIMKLMSLFSNNYAIVMNVYYILTYVLATVTALFAFREFKISYIPSLIGSLLFAFVSYHFLRNETHLFLSSYYMIPLVIMVILWLFLDENIILFYDEEKKKFKWNIKYYKSILSIIICLLIGSTGIYYAFFACFFLFISIISILIKKGKFRGVIVPIIFILLICSSVIINLSPSIVNQLKNGKNVEVATRSPIEAEIYQMKITQLLMPIDGHGIPILDKLVKKYASFPNPNEGSEYLGIVGCVGFLLLILKLLRKTKESYNETIIDALSKLNIAAILLATVGGLGTIFAIVISPQIRAYNRISVYIDFFSVFCFIMLFDNIKKRYFKSQTQKVIFGMISLLILAVGIWDQVPKRLIPDYSGIKQEYISDDQFVKNIENQMPKGSMIFQLPYVPFPENPPVNNMSDYELFKGYLHSNNLKWSYGSFKGRDFDLWQREISKLPINELIEKIILFGFDGIYLDRAGFDEKTDNMVQESISSLTDSKPIISSNNRLVFYDISEYAKKLKAQYAEDEWNEKEKSEKFPLILSWNKGFYDLEGTTDQNWRWCSNEGELYINNTADTDKKINIEMDIFTGYDTLSELTIDSKILQESMKINSKGNHISKTIVVPPGNNIINLKSNAQQIIAPNDSRNLVFRVVNFKYTEV